MGFLRIVTPSSTSQKKENLACRKRPPRPKEVSASGLKQLVCDNVIDVFNCGLVDKLTTKQTRSDTKLIKPKQSTKRGSHDKR